jgi:hypothetical protein
VICENYKNKKEETMRNALLLCTTFLTMTAFGAEYHVADNLMLTGFDFAAPSVNGTTNAQQQVGGIIFDTSAGQFKGLTSASGWVPMSSGAGTTAPVVKTFCSSGCTYGTTGTYNALDLLVAATDQLDPQTLKFQ